MALKTVKEYLASLRELNLDVHLLGQKVTDWVDHPIIRPSINSVAMTYQLAQEADTRDLAVCQSGDGASEVNRFNSLFTGTDDLVAKVKLQRLLGQKTGSCFQRCVGLDAINAVYSVTYEIDKEYRTAYHRRFCDWLRHVQQNDLFVQGAMTDVKGDRGLRPSQQADPDMFVHVVKQNQEGLVLRGAKANQTGTVSSHEMLIMPTLSLREEEKQYAVCCAVPTDTRGVHIIYGRQSCDTRKLEDSRIDVGNRQFGGHETLNILDDVFVPWERVFMNGEVKFTGRLVERFASYHRQSYGGCKAGVGDVLIGAAAQIAEYNGVAKAPHIREKIAEMIHLTETIHACGLACSYEGEKTQAGNYQSNTLLANVCKHNVTRFPYEVCRLAEDIAGGLLVTLPSEKDLAAPETGKLLEKYLKGVADFPTENRFRILTLIHAITMGASAPSYRTESMHGAGSPQAQKIMIERQTDLEYKKDLARRLAGIDPGQDLDD